MRTPEETAAALSLARQLQQKRAACDHSYTTAPGLAYLFCAKCGQRISVAANWTLKETLAPLDGSRHGMTWGRPIPERGTRMSIEGDDE